MLALRLGIVTAAAALCLWGLFSLLDSLQEPGLLRSSEAIVVKGCESPDSAQAMRQCPGLFCQKAVLDARLAPLQARLELRFDRTYDNDERLIAGQASTAADAVSYFACDLTGPKVTDVRSISRQELDELLESS